MDPKKRVWLWGGIVLLAGVGLATAGKAPPSPPVGAPPLKPRRKLLSAGSRLLLIGDSFAEGLAVPLKQIAKEAKVEFSADGRKGTRIEQWANNSWLVLDLQFKPTIILVSLGTNDMVMNDPSVEQPALDKLVSTLRASGAAPIWIGPPTVPFVDKGVRKMIDDTKLPVFKSESLTLPRAPDKLHPTAAGYAGWAGALWGWLDQTTIAVV